LTIGKKEDGFTNPIRKDGSSGTVVIMWGGGYRIWTPCKSNDGVPFVAMRDKFGDTVQDRSYTT
jgi:hypothetical protein